MLDNNIAKRLRQGLSMFAPRKDSYYVFKEYLDNQVTYLLNNPDIKKVDIGITDTIDVKGNQTAYLIITYKPTKSGISQEVYIIKAPVYKDNMPLDDVEVKVIPFNGPFSNFES